jgi:hypothetical protein
VPLKFLVLQERRPINTTAASGVEAAVHFLPIDFESLGKRCVVRFVQITSSVFAGSHNFKSRFAQILQGHIVVFIGICPNKSGVGRDDVRQQFDHFPQDIIAALKIGFNFHFFDEKDVIPAGILKISDDATGVPEGRNPARFPFQSLMNRVHPGSEILLSAIARGRDFRHIVRQNVKQFPAVLPEISTINFDILHPVPPKA